MPIIFSSNNLSQLKDYSMKERQVILSMASDKLITPQKLVINIIKLLILIPPFIMVARLDSWMLFLPLIFVLAGYFLIMRPINLYFLKQHLSQAINQFERQKNS